ncbi:MAG: hypothetical protein WAR80_08660, partial [Ferruginibacter sp.]
MMKTKILFLFSLVMIGLTLSTSAQKKKYYKKGHSKNIRYKNGKYRHATAPAPRVVVLPLPPAPV